LVQIRDIGLEDDMIFVPKDSPSAQSRWLYYPDHLVKLPHPSQGILQIAQTLFTEDAFDGYKLDLATELLKDGRTHPIEDESVADFVSRRVNSKLVDKVLSAVLHGIYAGDAYQLSAKSLLPDLWYGEREHTSIIQGVLDKNANKLMRREDWDLLEYLEDIGFMDNEPLKSKLAASSVFTMKNGLQQLADGLLRLLNMTGTVTIETSAPVEKIGVHPESEDEKKLQVRLPGSMNRLSRYSEVFHFPGND
jgi:oxygen-dependent protoporphyrinogen oxidase